MIFHFKAFTKTGDQEELHQFRVQVKKLRALLIMLDSIFPKGKLARDFKPVRRIFKHLGDIRNAYINLQLGVRYKLSNQEFIDRQVYAIENGTFKVKKQSKAYLRDMKYAFKQLEDELPAPSDDQINEFYKTQLEQVAIGLTMLQFNDGLHDYRKQIKTLFYNRKLVQNALNGKLELDINYLDKLQDSIGNWHDNILAIELFSSPEVDDKPVVTKLKRQNTRLKKSISLLANDFWKKAIVINEPAAANEIK